jgi:3-hydroxyisobutyrate dehydrogenase-like beta-hydroxyacid dehydrogenase
MLERAVPLVLDRNFKPGTAVNLIVKDLGLIQALATQLGTPLRMGERASEVFSDGRDGGLGDDDMSGLVRPYEAAAGVEVKRSE